jgi:signal transduction histidine kinase/CheY-like chemotaxis protein
MPAPEMLIALDMDTNLAMHSLNGQTKAADTRKKENGLLEYVLKTNEPLLVSASAIDLMTSEQIIEHSGQIPQSWIGIPLKTRESVIGVLCLQSFTTETTYSEDEKTILLFIAEQIALAIQKIKSEEFLIKAKNSAENSSRLKSSLLANMSHELRTPMTGILGFSEILNEELEDPRLKSMAGTIFKSAGRLMSTLNSIIDLSALEADKNSLRLKSVNTRLMMQPLLKVAYSIASDKGLYLRTAIPPDLFVHSDEKLLSQLLHHLIDNALKFTVDGGISISAYKLNKTSTEATIRISDTGIGIAPEHHKMIFEEFRQVSEGFSRTFEGSGLGLSLCSKISRLLNVKIWVDSVEGKGSDFFVELPIAAPGEADEHLNTDVNPTIRTHRLSRGSVPEVLIVEDNEINRRLAALYLREICNTEMAENGYVAIEKIKRRKYDAILMDINLGAGPDGLSIAHQVRNYEINKNTPIIAVTGYTMHGDREKLLANGCSHYLPKPYDKQTLLKLFSSILYK